MAVFQYILKDNSGTRKEGEIQASTLDAAIHNLTDQEQVIISIKELDTSWDFLGPFLDEVNLSYERFKSRVPLSNLVFFTRQLATMFSAGLTIEKSIKGLASDEKHPRLRKILKKVVLVLFIFTFIILISDSGVIRTAEPIIEAAEGSPAIEIFFAFNSF